MQRTLTAGMLILAVGTASGGYAVERGTGDRMTVGSYWMDGDGGAAAVAVQAADRQPAHEELERRRATVERHLLRVQRERFEAAARGEPAPTLRRLEREFRRTQARRRTVLRALERFEHAE